MLRMVEVHRACGLGHSRGILVNVGVLFRSLCRHLNRERLRFVIGSVGTNLCDDADDVRSLNSQGNCSSLVIHPGPVNLVVMLLKPNE